MVVTDDQFRIIMGMIMCVPLSYCLRFIRE